MWLDTTSYWSKENMNGRVADGELHLKYWQDTGFDGDALGVDLVYDLIQSFDGALYAATGTEYDEFVFRSTDGGDSWHCPGIIPNGNRGYSLIQARDSTLYVAVHMGAGASDYGAVWKSTDLGVNWEETGNLHDADGVSEILEASDSTLYATAYYDSASLIWWGIVFTSTDRGASWDSTAEFPARTIWARPILEDFQGDIYVGAQTRINGKSGGESRPSICFDPFDDASTWPSLDPLARGSEVFKSTNGGVSWDTTGDLPEGIGMVWCLLQTADSALYGGTNSDGYVVKSTNFGGTWQKTGDLPEHTTSTLSLLEISSARFIYSGGAQGGNIFRTTDGGDNWLKVGDLERMVTSVMCLLEDSRGAVYAGTAHASHVLRGGYTTGYLVSSIYDTGDDSDYGMITWDADTRGQTLSVKVRTDTLSNMATAPPWGSCLPCSNGQDISDLASVNDGDRYIQYRVEMSTEDEDTTPILYEISIEYTTTGVTEQPWIDNVPNTFALSQNHPNPFNMTTEIRYLSVGRRSLEVSLKIYDILGQEVRTLVDEKQPPGLHSVLWDGKDDRGEEMPTGIYLYRLTTGGFEETKKAMLLK